MNNVVWSVSDTIYHGFAERLAVIHSTFFAFEEIESDH